MSKSGQQLRQATTALGEWKMWKCLEKSKARAAKSELQLFVGTSRLQLHFSSSSWQEKNRNKNKKPELQLVKRPRTEINHTHHWTAMTQRAGGFLLAMIRWLFQLKYQHSSTGGSGISHAHNSWKTIRQTATICANIYTYPTYICTLEIHIHMFKWVKNQRIYMYWYVLLLQCRKMRFTFVVLHFPFTLFTYRALNKFIFRNTFCLPSRLGSVLAVEIFMALTALCSSAFCLVFWLYFPRNPICSSFNCRR